jgi:hypothetical protein
MTDQGETPPLIGARRGWSLRQRFFAVDSYGLLLVMILLSLVVSALSITALDRVLPAIRVLVLGGTFAFALHTSAASRRAYAVCAGMIVLPLILAALVDADSRLGDALQSAGAFLLIAGVLITVTRRFASHPVVTGSSILAAICIYLFVGLGFATIYGFVAAADIGPLFAGGAGDGTSAERVYYSFITLTTTGYGDFVPATDVARMVAITQALIGQIYLVTIVALLIANIGSSRRRRDDMPPTVRPDEG